MKKSAGFQGRGGGGEGKNLQIFERKKFKQTKIFLQFWSRVHITPSKRKIHYKKEKRKKNWHDLRQKYFKKTNSVDRLYKFHFNLRNKKILCAGHRVTISLNKPRKP